MKLRAKTQFSSKKGTVLKGVQLVALAKHKEIPLGASAFTRNQKIDKLISHKEQSEEAHLERCHKKSHPRTEFNIKLHIPKKGELLTE